MRSQDNIIWSIGIYWTKCFIYSLPIGKGTIVETPDIKVIHTEENKLWKCKTSRHQPWNSFLSLSKFKKVKCVQIVTI